MADDIKRLEAKLDKMLEVVSEIKVELSVNTGETAQNRRSLEDHMEQTMILKGELLKEKENTDARLKPLEKAHWLWVVVGKALLATAVLLSAIGSFIKALR